MRHAGYSSIGRHNPSTCCVVTAFVLYVRLTVFIIIGIIGLGLRFEGLFASTVVSVIGGRRGMIMVGCCVRRIGRGMSMLASSESRHHLRSLMIGS